MNNQQAVVEQPDVTMLMKGVEEFVKKYQKRHRGNFHAGWLLVMVGLLLSASVTVAGILNQPIIAALLGVCIAFAIGVQNAFPLGDKAEFYRLIIAESENLLFDLRYGRVKTEADFEAALDRFQKLNKHAAASLPRGKGMDAVKEMYVDLSKTVAEG